MVCGCRIAWSYFDQGCLLAGGSAGPSLAALRLWRSPCSPRALQLQQAQLQPALVPLALPTDC